MNNPILGQTPVTIAGERRTLVCDMNAGATLFDFDQHWTLWLAERFVARPQKVDGRTVMQLPPLSPADLSIALYAMLSTDRAQKPREESPDSLRMVIGINQIASLQQACTRAVLAGLGVPGEGIEAVASE